MPEHFIEKSKGEANKINFAFINSSFDEISYRAEAGTGVAVGTGVGVAVTSRV